jgi:hypothetical protein
MSLVMIESASPAPMHSETSTVDPVSQLFASGSRFNRGVIRKISHAFMGGAHDFSHVTMLDIEGNED